MIINIIIISSIFVPAFSILHFQFSFRSLFSVSRFIFHFRMFKLPKKLTNNDQKGAQNCLRRGGPKNLFVNSTSKLLLRIESGGPNSYKKLIVNECKRQIAIYHKNLFFPVSGGRGNGFGDVLEPIWVAKWSI